MATENTNQMAQVLEIKGEAWLHQDDKVEAVAGHGHLISLGDILVTAPTSEALVQLNSGEKITVGSERGDALLFDQALQDVSLDRSEVAIHTSSLQDASFILDAQASPQVSFFSGLMAEHETGIVGHLDDSALDFKSLDLHHSQAVSAQLEARDIISEFNPATDRFLLPNSSVIASGPEVYVKAQHLVQLDNLDIAFHKIDSHGGLSFKDANGHEITLTDARMLGPVIDYLSHNFNGNPGDTLVFKVANDSYIYHYHPEIYAQHFSLTKFAGISFDGMSYSHDTLMPNYLYVDFS
jgi:hypothetical protein